MMQNVLLKKLASRAATLSVAAVLSAGLVACGDTDFLPGDNDRGANRSFNTLNEVVIADCNDKPEDTQPLSVSALTFTNPRPENTQPENSAEGQACI